MKTIHAIYENGVFRPVEPVDLPDGMEVELELRVPEDLEALSSDKGMAEIYEILGRRYHSGEHDVAARHNEHQP